MAAEKAVRHLDANRVAFAAGSGEFHDISRKISEQMHGIGAYFRQQSQEMTRAAETTGKEVDTLGEQLLEQTNYYTKALETAASKAGEITTIYSQQVDALIQASEHAASEASRVRASALDARRDTFLRSSKFILEDLNSIGIDISRIIDKTEAEKLWKVYVKGDKNVFVRALVKSNADEKKVQETIKRKYQDDDTFRRHVVRYLDQFQSLLAQANESDPENLLSSTFVTADVGKLYVLLSRAVGRMN